MAISINIEKAFEKIKNPIDKIDENTRKSETTGPQNKGGML